MKLRILIGIFLINPHYCISYNPTKTSAISLNLSLELDTQMIARRILLSLLILFIFLLNGFFLTTNSFAQKNESNPQTFEKKEFPTLLNRTNFGLDTLSAPLKYPKTVLLPLPEMIVWGRDSGFNDFDDLNGYIYDDIIHLNTSTKDFEVEDNLHDVDIAWGEFGGDGLVEMFLIARQAQSPYDIEGWFYDDYQHDYARSPVFTGPGKQLTSAKPTVLCGDFDRQNWDDVFVAWASSDYNVTMKIIKWTGSWTAVWTREVTLLTGAQLGTLDSAQGDFDGDGLPEIAVTFAGGGLQAHVEGCVIDYTNWGEYQVIHEWNADWGAERMKIAAGDVDGDFRDELLFLGVQQQDATDGDLRGRLLDDALTGFHELHQWAADDNSDQPQPAMGDVDADGKDELVFYSTDAPLYGNHDMNLWIWDDTDGNYALLVNMNNDDNWGEGEVACGDMDLDGDDEIVLVVEVADATVYHKLYTVVYRYDGPDTRLYPIETHISDRRTADPVLALADVHHDGVIAEYVGESTPATSVTGPEVMVAMAVPPFIEGIDQRTGACSSKFGESETTGGTDSNSVTISHSITATFEVEWVPKVFKTKVSLGFSHGLTSSASNSSAVTRATYYSISSKDGVVYAKTTLSHFDYRVSYHPTNASAIGNIMTINVPTSSDIYKTDIDYFDGLFPDYHLRAKIFNHIIGDASSYPSRSDFDSIISEPCWERPAILVGQGTGSVSTSITVSEVMTQSQSRTLSTSVSTGMSIGDFGGSAGVTAGASYSTSRARSITIGEAVTYSGSVGDISEANYEDYKYQFGLIVYAFNDTDFNTVYQVLNYWTNGAKSPPEGPSTETSTEGSPTETSNPLGFSPLYLLATVGVLIGKVFAKKRSKGLHNES